MKRYLNGMMLLGLVSALSVVACGKKEEEKIKFEGKWAYCFNHSTTQSVRITLDLDGKKKTNEDFSKLGCEGPAAATNTYDLDFELKESDDKGNFKVNVKDSSGTVKYTIFKIEGNLLREGMSSDGLDGSAEGTRHKLLDSNVYTKQ